MRFALPLGSRALSDGMSTAPPRRPTSFVTAREEPSAPGVADGTEPLDEGDRPTPLTPLDARVVETPSPRQASFVRLDGPSAGVLTPLRAGMRLGRARAVDVHVDDDEVSRVHAEVRFEGGAWVLVDLGSRNGTRVDGVPCSRRVLADGDVVQLGRDAAFRFSLMDSRHEALLSRLYHSSVRDALTGAYNRAHFDERLHGEIAYAVRHQTELSLVLFDLDHFKRINDGHGHAAGDAVLRYVAAVVSSRIREEDVFARQGGEEFAVLLRGIGLAGAARAAERLRGAVAGGATTFEGRLVPVTLSAGCASLACCPSSEAGRLFAIADRRLYAAKDAGRNRVVASDD